MTIKHELQTIISSFFNVDVSQISDWHRLNGCNHVRTFCGNGEK
jgi:hypothetical protein